MNKLHLTATLAFLFMTMTSTTAHCRTPERPANAERRPLDIAITMDAPGKPKAVVIALHGIQTNAEWFRPLGVELAKGGISLRAVNIGVRGGLNPSAAHATDWRADWVQPLLAVAAGQSARGRAPVFLLGTSWGARPVLQAVMEERGAVSGAVLIAPALSTKKDKAFFGRAKLAPRAWFAPRDRAFKIPLDADDYTADKNISGLWLDEHSAQGRLLVREVTYGFMEQTFALRKVVERGLERLRAPVLALFGTSDPLVNLDKADRLLSLPQHALVETRLIPGGTHAMQLEQPEAVAREIAGWIDRQLPGDGVVHLNSRNDWQDCGIHVEKGCRYFVKLVPAQRWQDAGLRPCSPNEGAPTIMRLLGWLRRVKTDTADRAITPLYFRPIGTVSQDLATAFVITDGREWVAPASGVLHSFANDAAGRYANNHGTVTFRLVKAAGATQ